MTQIGLNIRMIESYLLRLFVHYRHHRHYDFIKGSPRGSGCAWAVTARLSL